MFKSYKIRITECVELQIFVLRLIEISCLVVEHDENIWLERTQISFTDFTFSVSVI